MRDLCQMSPEDVLRVFFAERRRRENPPSLSGLEPDAPKEKRPASGVWEELLGLTRGCSPHALEIMYVASGMWKVKGWVCSVEGCGQFIDHRHSDVLGTDGHPLTAGGKTVTEPVTNHVPPVELAQRYGLERAQVAEMVAEVLNVVAENIGRRKGNSNTYTEDPAIESWRLWSRGGW